MGVPRINELYFLFKFYFLKQIRSNGLTEIVFNELLKTNMKTTRLSSSFFGQIADVSGFLGIDCLSIPVLHASETIKARFSCLECGLVNKIIHVFNEWDIRSDSRALLPLLRTDRDSDDEFEHDRLHV